MSYYYNTSDFTKVAGADLSNACYLGAVIDATGVIIAGAGVRIVGVIQEDSLVDQAVKVQHTGVTKAVSGAAIVAGAEVEVDAAGKFVPGTTQVVGIALEATAAADEVFPLKLV